MRVQVVVAAVGDSLELEPADREQVLEVARRARVVRQLRRLVRTDTQMARTEPEVEEPAISRLDPVLEPLRRVGGWHEELHLHLLELPQAEEEVPGRDLVAEALADLRDPERRLHAQRRGDVLEVDEDPLCRLGAEVRARGVVEHRPDLRLEHEVERARLCQVALRRLAGRHGRLLPARALLEGVRAEAQLARAAVHERVGEALEVPRGGPDRRVEDHGGIERHDVVALLDQRAQPLVLHVLLQEDAVVAVVVGGAEPAVDVRGGVDEAATPGQCGDLLDRRDAAVGLELLRVVARAHRPAMLRGECPQAEPAVELVRRGDDAEDLARVPLAQRDVVRLGERPVQERVDGGERAR